MPNIITPPSHPERQRDEPVTADYLAAQLRWLDYHDGYWDDGIHHRLIELEHALISGKARRRLRREIRRSDRQFSWAGSGFRARRVEAAFNEYSTQMNEREGRSAA